jgi:FAD/FMN-containing dehydrogenase/Fe-S oxidoreductase
VESGKIAVMDVPGLIAELRRTAVGNTRSDAATREMYATDASLYRRVPVVALRARGADDVGAAVAACGRYGVPVTFRGAGTSLAGQTVGRGLVVDCSALNGIEVVPEERTARVGPGAVLDRLNDAAGVHGLQFGPDVATSNRATLGGMIGNNSAGARSVVHGLTADHVLELDVVLADGTLATLRRGGAVPAVLMEALPLVTGTRFPSLMRRVSGYNLDALAGDDPDWVRLLVGAEGTLCAIRSAVVRLVDLPATRGLALVGYRDTVEALEAVPSLLDTGPSAVELIDRALVDPANRSSGGAALVDVGTGLRDAGAMLLVEYSGEGAEVAERLGRLPGATMFLDPADQARVWAMRRSGIARALGGGGDAKPIAFVEDPAVPPDRLADFYREARAVLDGENVPAVWYGHASVGCLHIRPLMDLRGAGAPAAVRRIAEAVADLVVSHDGSLSGEHGDGRARSELLPRMYDPATIAAFSQLKHLLDPQGIMNPGIIVDGEPLDSGLRLLDSPPLEERRTHVSFSREGGLQRAAEACNGNGACRTAIGVMCPSYQALGDERHSPRGRASIFRAAVEGRLRGGLADDGLHEALDLCLGCKACASECPASVDMARMKVEALAQRYAERGAPVAARLAGRAHGLLSAGSRAPRLARAGSAIAGRRLGRQVPTPVARWRPHTSRTDGKPVVLMADTFTRFLHPEVGDAAVRVLEAAGARVEVVDPGCCGRPLLSQGFVDAATGAARKALDKLAPSALDGTPIVVLEPSCWSMLIDDLPKLLADDPRAPWVAESAISLEAALRGLDPLPLADDDADVLVHPHCHSRALGDGNAALDVIAGGAPRAHTSPARCCGMAGAFGYTHPELSRQIAELGLAPAARAADIVVAAGTSCRAQVEGTTGRSALHPAEYLAARLRP